MTNTFYQYAGNLIENGYDVKPIGPGVKYPQEYREIMDADGRRGEWVNAWNWQTKDYDPEVAKFWPECGIGICTGEVVAVDIDILDQILAAETQVKFENAFGPAVLVRVWKHPKRILLYRTDVPFDKMKMGKIEILGQGQQFVAYGVHPETGGRTQWVTGDSPEDTPVSKLALVTQQQVLDALTEINAGLPSEHRGDAVRRGIYGQQTDVITNMVRGTDDGLRAIMPYLPNGDIHWDDWNRVGMLLYAATAGGDLGFELFDTFSKKSPKYDGKATQDRWQTLHRSPPNRSPGMRGLCAEAKENGWIDDGIHTYADLKGQDVPMETLLRKMGVGAKPKPQPAPAPVWAQPANVVQRSAWPLPPAQPQLTSGEEVTATDDEYDISDASDAELIDNVVREISKKHEALKPEVVDGLYKYTGVNEDGELYEAWVDKKLGSGMHPNSPLLKIHETPVAQKNTAATMRMSRVLSNSPTLVSAVDDLFDVGINPEIAKFFRAVRSVTSAPPVLALAAGLGVASTVVSAAYRVAALNTSGRMDNYGSDQTGLYMLVAAPSGSGKNALRAISKIISPDRHYANYVQNEVTGKHALENHLRTNGRCLYLCSDEAGKKSKDKSNHETSAHEFLLQMYDADEFKATARAGSAVSKPFQIPNPAITYAAISTPQDLFSTFSDEAMAGGYANRMLMMPAIKDEKHFRYVHPTDGEEAMAYATAIVDAIAAGAVAHRKTANKVTNMSRKGDPRADLAAIYTTCASSFSLETTSAIEVMRPEADPVILQIPAESMLVISSDLSWITGMGSALGVDDFNRATQTAKRLAAVLQRIRTAATPEDLIVSPSDAKMAAKLVIGCLEAMINCREEYSARSRIVDLSNRILDVVANFCRKTPGGTIAHRDLVKRFKNEEDVPKAIDRLVYHNEIVSVIEDNVRRYSVFV